MSFFETVQIKTADTPSSDAFGRLRVAQPTTVFDGKTLSDSQPLKYDDQEVSGSGTGSTFSVDTSSVTLSVGTTTAGKRVRQTRRRFDYIPGKSYIAYLTFQFGTSGSGIKKAAGYFNDKDGIFLQDNEGAIEFIQRSSTTGSPVNITTPRENWNVDKMDGTGPSGKTLDFTENLIVVIDMQSLGVGRVRLGFNIDGRTFVAHELQTSSLLAPYLSTPNLPIRYEIENDGAGASNSIVCLGSAIISEGGNDLLLGRPFGFFTDPPLAITTGAKYGIMGLRLKSTHIDNTLFLPTHFSIVGTTQQDNFGWEILLNPSIAGTVNFSPVNNSGVETFLGDATNTVTGGTPVIAGVGFSQAILTIGGQGSELQLGASIDDTQDIVVVAVKPFSNLSVATGLSWRELS